MLRYLLYLFHVKKPQNYKNWLQFLFIIKTAVLKQQILKFYQQIRSTKDSFYIYDKPLTEETVRTIVREEKGQSILLRFRCC